MANIKTAKKRILINQKKAELNKSRKSEIKTYIKKFEAAIEAGNTGEAQELLKVIDRKLKKATHKNIYHVNAASRKISNLTKQLNKAM